MLHDRGYNAHIGTFGSVLSLPVKNGYWPVETDASLLGLTEKEIVVVDLAVSPEVRPVDALGTFCSPHRTTVGGLIGYRGAWAASPDAAWPSAIKARLLLQSLV